MDEYIITKIDDDFLAHHGILGMKWGVRRYQNKDGSLTAAGKKHRSEEVSKMSDEELRKAVNRQRLENEAKDYILGKNNSGTAQRAANNAANVANQIGNTTAKGGSKDVVTGSANVVRSGANIGKNISDSHREKMKKEIDLSMYSDKDLQKFVDRQRMEEQYVNGLDPKSQKSGAEKVAKTLEIVGSAAAVAASAITIYNGIQKIKGERAPNKNWRVPKSKQISMFD